MVRGAWNWDQLEQENELHDETRRAQEEPSIRVQASPPAFNQEGTTTIRTLHGWATIPGEWLEPNITDDVRAMLSNLLHQRILIGTH